MSLFAKLLRLDPTAKEDFRSEVVAHVLNHSPQLTFAWLKTMRATELPDFEDIFVNSQEVLDVFAEVALMWPVELMLDSALRNVRDRLAVLREYRRRRPGPMQSAHVTRWSPRHSSVFSQPLRSIQSMNSMHFALAPFRAYKRAKSNAQPRTRRRCVLSSYCSFRGW